MLNKIKNKTYEFLKWTEKWTKTDMIYLVKGSFWLNMSQILTMSVNLILTVVFANFVDPAEYGTYKFIVSFILILAIPSLPGINTALIKSVAQGNENTIIVSLKTRIKWGLISGLAATSISLYYLYQGNSTLFVAFFILAIFMPIMEPLDIWQSYYNGKKDFKTLSKFKFITELLKVITIVLTLVFTQKVIFILLSYLIITTTTRASFNYIIIKKNKLIGGVDFKSIGLGKHLSLIGVLSSFSSRIDKILIFHFLGPIELAIYTFAQAPISYYRTPLLTINQLLFPKLSESGIASKIKSLPDKIKKLLIVIFILVIIYILIIPLFFNLVFPKYTEAIIYSQALSLTLLFFPQTMIVQALVASAEKKMLYTITTIIPTFKIVLFLILLPLYGIWGVVISEILSRALNSFMLFFILKKLNTDNL